jgi:tetratricopeptide (TPR) repeat protein
MVKNKNIMKLLMLALLLVIMALVVMKYTIPNKHNVTRSFVYCGWRLACLSLHSPAVFFYNMAARIEPGYYQIYVFRGDSYLVLNNEEKSELDFKRALEIKPGDRHAISSLCMLYAKKNDFYKAIEGYETLAMMDPKQSDYCYIQIGMYYHLLKDFKKALETYGKVKKPDFEYSNMYINRAMTYLALHEYELAEEDCKKAIALDPTQQDNLSGIYNAIQNSKEKYIQNITKLDYLKRALDEKPKGIDILSDMANIYIELGKYDNAVNCYTAIIDMNDGTNHHNNAYYSRGSLYYDYLNDTLKAIEDMKISAFNGNSNAKKWLSDKNISF